MEKVKQFSILLKYLLLLILGLLVIVIASKFQQVEIPKKSEFFITVFFRYNLTVPVQLIYVAIGFLFGYFSKLKPLFVGFALFMFLPLGTLVEAIIIYPSNTSYNLFPFLLIFQFIYTLPTIFSGYLGRFISKISASGKQGFDLLQEIITKHSNLFICLSFCLLGMLIIGICSLFHFHFNNLLQFEDKTGKDAFFFYANYSNQAIYVFAVIGILIGYGFKSNPFLAGLSLYLVFPLSTIFSMFFGILPLKEGLFMEWIPFVFPTMLAVLVGWLLSRVIKIKTL